jgi:hypothetical protein
MGTVAKNAVVSRQVLRDERSTTRAAAAEVRNGLEMKSRARLGITCSLRRY